MVSAACNGGGTRPASQAVFRLPSHTPIARVLDARPGFELVATHDLSTRRYSAGLEPGDRWSPKIMTDGGFLVVRLSRVEIHRSARRHQVPDEDISHACEHPVAWVELGDARRGTSWPEPTGPGTSWSWSCWQAKTTSS